MQVFINALAGQVRRLGRPVELVLVDWNPPPDHPPLSEALTAPAVEGFVARAIQVPREVHAALSASENLAFFQMIAKNVGIRRATGDAVLATNIDILLSDELFLDSTGPLADRHVYRADRVDLPFDPAETMDPDQIRHSTPIRINTKSAITPLAGGQGQQYVRGGRALARVALADPVDFTRRMLRRAGLDRYRRSLISVFVLPQLHLNACGDFTLMTRRSWCDLGGYPEWEMFSWNLDSMLLFQAAAAGFEFVELAGHPAYHLEHSSGFSLEAQSALFDRLAARGVPVLTDPAALDVNHEIWRGRKQGRWRTNLAGWGMAERDLPETTLRAG
jgi:hypothetical protein